MAAVKAIRSSLNPGFDRLEAVNCNLCGSGKLRPVYQMPDYKYFPDEWFTVVECTECGLGFVNPRPAPGGMQRYYPKEFYDFFRDSEEFNQRRYAVEAAFLGDIVPANGRPRLLDVGCANGDFPRFMQARGWDVEGVEVSESADPISDFKVYRQEFPEIAAGEPSYDAITAWAVLEHVHDPMGYFRKAAELLKPGGRFAFLVTNFASVSSRALFREDLPRHLYFFTESAVARYLTLAGLDLLRVEYGRKIYQMIPAKWLRYYFYRLIGRDFNWPEASACRASYFADQKLKPGIVSTLRWAFSNPGIAILDGIGRRLTPIYEQCQIFAKSYGIATYLAVKPGPNQWNNAPRVDEHF